MVREVIINVITLFFYITAFVLITTCDIFVIVSNLTITQLITYLTYSHRDNTCYGIQTLISVPVHDFHNRRNSSHSYRWVIFQTECRYRGTLCFSGPPVPKQRIVGTLKIRLSPWLPQVIYKHSNSV